MEQIIILERNEMYMDFEVEFDSENIYRYEKGEDTFHKLLGFGKGNRGKAIRGNKRKEIEKSVKYLFENFQSLN